MDPLANLKDIALSEPVHNLPIAIGWWVLLALILIAIFVIVKRINKQKALNRDKKAALLQLEAQRGSASEMLKTLKWATMAYYPREVVASLHGTDYITFLKNQLSADEQSKFVENITPVLDSIYSAEQETNNELAFESISLWINKALPPKAGGKHD